MCFGVIGTGPIVERFLSAGGLCPEFVLDAVYSRDEGRARRLADQFGGHRALDNLEAMLDSPHVEAVYIASPNALHREHALAAIRHGKHVLCEKAAASNCRELDEVLAAAEKAGVLFLEAARHLFSPGFAKVQSLLPRLGTIRRVSLVYDQYSSRYDKFKAGIVENAFNPALSNGALMDIGVYCVQLLVALFGPPREIASQSVRLHNGLDGQGTAIARYDDMVAQLSYSKISDSVTPSVIQGEAASLLFQPLSNPEWLQLVPRGGPPQQIPWEAPQQDMRWEIEAFMNFAQNPQGAAFYQRCSRDSLALMDEMRRQQGIVFPADGE